MSTFKLTFQSPKGLNENQDFKTLEKPQWVHIDGSELEINVEDWVIHKIGKKGSCKLANCEADESSYKIKFKGEQADGDYQVIDYPFAVSMLGQIIPKEDLIHYLKQLQNQFQTEKPKEPHNEDSETSMDKKEKE